MPCWKRDPQASSVSLGKNVSTRSSWRTWANIVNMMLGVSGISCERCVTRSIIIKVRDPARCTQREDLADLPSICHQICQRMSNADLDRCQMVSCSISPPGSLNSAFTSITPCTTRSFAMNQCLVSSPQTIPRITGQRLILGVPEQRLILLWMMCDESKVRICNV